MAQPALRVVKDDEGGLGRPLPLKLTQIVRFEGQPRRFFDPKSIEELADSIQEEGQKTPVKVCKHHEQKGVFVLIGGERRWRAFHLIQERTGTEPFVDAFIDVVRDTRHHFREALIDNLHREDLIPLDEAAAYHRMHFQDSMTKEAISKLVGKSYSHVDNYVRLHTLPDEVKKLMDPARPKDERLAVSAAIDIARSIPEAQLQVSVAQEAIERNLGIAETRTLIRVRTGRSGYGVGGRLRKPSDDYKVLASFFGRTLATAKRMRENLSIDDLYFHRDDEKEDRERDARTVRNIISHFNALLKEVEGGE